jgi:hypothetical protein
MSGMNRTNCNFMKEPVSAGSALILTVVLTSMLAIVGILFVMMARVDKVATSAISEDRELSLAVETVIARISQQLVWDIPGVAGHEYYDYPDVNNTWLASLEPYLDGMGVYRWRQISDVNNQLGPNALDLQPAIMPDYQSPLQVGDSNMVLGIYPADADGDGASDSVWIKMPDMTSSTGEPVYVAVRVVDNGGMLNANTDFRFDPNVVDSNMIDGSSQLQINLMALSGRPGVFPYDPIDESDLLLARANNGVGVDPCDLIAYERNVIWHYVQPNGSYTPFDISDELEIRYRYLLNQTDIDTRLEAWGGEFRINAFSTPALPGQLNEWLISAYDTGVLDPNYAYRHLATTYNMDRIVDPNGEKMINVNTETSVLKIYNALWRSMYPFVPDPDTDQRFAQLAVNMVDFVDEDDNNLDGVLDVNDGNCVSTLVDSSGTIHYGFEAQPFINEIAWNISPSPADNLNFFALELCNPFDKDIDLGNFVLEFVSRDGAKQYSITFPAGQVIEANGYFVIVNQPGRFVIFTDPNTPTTVWVDPALRFFENWLTLDKSKPPVDPRPGPDRSKPPIPEGWGTIYDVSLKRGVFVPVAGTMLYVDNQIIDANQALPATALALGRDDRDWRVIYQTLSPGGVGSLGIANYRQIRFYEPSFPKHLYSFFLPNPLAPRARLITVGDIPRILTLGHGTTPDITIGRQLMAYQSLERSTAVVQEHNVRLDLRNPLHRNVFQYLTVFDPNSDGINNDDDVVLLSDGTVTALIDEGDGSEWRVPGRININTAPWYVLAQLPWVSQRSNQPFNYSLARAVVSYRDKLPVPVDYSIGRYNAIIANSPLNDDFAASFPPGSVREQPGFASIGELNFVIAGLNNFNIAEYALNDIDLPGFPDLTTADDDPLPDAGDEVIDDFEERDVIFSRISNLVTVRSDVFTAYILVRIGTDGPQKRAVAILDRSGVNKTNYNLPDGKVRIVALQYVPDPR